MQGTEEKFTTDIERKALRKCSIERGNAAKMQRFFYFLRKNVRFGTIWDDLERFCTIWNDLVRLTCYSGIQESSRGVLLSCFLLSSGRSSGRQFFGCLPCIKRGRGCIKCAGRGFFGVYLTLWGSVKQRRRKMDFFLIRGRKRNI